MPTNDNDDSKVLLTYYSNLLRAPKQLDGKIEWKRDHNIYRFELPLIHNGVGIEGAFLFARAGKGYPPGDITIGLKGKMGSGDVKNFERLDWRPRSDHNNQNVGPNDHRNKDIPGTHIHSFRLNAEHPSGAIYALKHNLPIAIPYPPAGGDSWKNVSEKIATEWRITNLMKMPCPLDEFPLFAEGNDNE